MYIDHHGIMTIENTRTGDNCILELHKAGKSLFGKAKNIAGVDGKAMDSSGNVHYCFKGQWNERLYFSPFNPKTKGFDKDNSTLLYEVEDHREDWERIYYFSTYTLQLNKLTSEMKEKLPPTDTRLRPDQRALENGDLTLASSEKTRIEEKQRESRKLREQSGAEWTPNYFEKYYDSDTGLDEYRYINDYWGDREARNWSHLPDLFGED